MKPEAVSELAARFYSGDGWTARDMAVATPDILVRMAWLGVGMKPLSDLGTLLGYADWRRDRMKRDSPRRKPVDIPSLLNKWVEVIVGLSTAHGHDGFTAADYQTDELLGPLLTAPIAQIRDFAQQLAQRLEADERIPFLVWSGYRDLIGPLVAKGPDGPKIALKKKLATEVAELAEKGLDQGQLVAAIANALQWRSEEGLKAVKESLVAGKAPKLVGRESCLFLEVGDVAVVL